MSLNWVLQPRDSNLCGQCAVAMLENVSLDESCSFSVTGVRPGHAT
jgi:hypothetical protein